MPELPEIETLRAQFSQLIVGKVIKSIDIFNQKSFIGDKKLVVNGEIVGVKRFAKILVIDFSNKLSMAVHLKMSGQLIYNLKSQPFDITQDKSSKVKNINQNSKIDNSLSNLPNKHTRVIINFIDGSRLFFNDIRMFGWIRIIAQNHNSNLQTLADITGKLGPEPLGDLTKDQFVRILKSTIRQIKLVLMDQEKIAGIGNIYANESLFLSKINPKIQAGKLSNRQSVELFNKLLQVLKLGIKWGGASVNNYRDAFGGKGRMQEFVCVYGKKGRKCPNGCGGEIKRILLGGRGTFYCPNCQL